MFNFTNFNKEEQQFIAERLENLLKEGIISGINSYTENVELDVCLPLSYLHHSATHEYHLKQYMQQKRRLKHLADSWKKREKRSIYRWEPSWRIKPEEKQTGIEFFILKTGVKIDETDILKADKISDVYTEDELVVAKDKGYDLNFAIDSRFTLIALINLFRKHASPVILGKNGLPELDNNGKPRQNPDAIPEAYSVPVIIYKDRFNLLGPITGFKPVHKIIITRDNDELSFYVDQQYTRLVTNQAFQELQKRFEKNYAQTIAFGNQLFINYLNK